MLTHDRLVKLYRELEGQDVLSVYVNGEQHDPAQRDAWRIRLDSGITALRRRLESVDGDGHLGAFDKAWEHIAKELRPFQDAFLPHRGWVAFATADRLWYAQGLPAKMPDLVRWERGARVAPYVRALKQERPVVVAVADSRKARLFEHVDGEITELEGLRADTFVGDLSDVGMRKSPARSSGQRGETSSDQAQRVLEVAAERMLKDLVSVLEERAGSNGIVVLGGTPETVRHMAHTMPKRLDGRVAQRPSMSMDMSLAQVREEVRAAAGDLSEAGHLALVGELADAARSGSLGSLGPEATEKALAEGRVDTLLLSRSFIREHPDFADRCVGAAFAQGADVEEVSGEAGERLDHEGKGVAARLRFRGSAQSVSLADGPVAQSVRAVDS